MQTFSSNELNWDQSSDLPDVSFLILRIGGHSEPHTRKKPRDASGLSPVRRMRRPANRQLLGRETEIDLLAGLLLDFGLEVGSLRVEILGR